MAKKSTLKTPWKKILLIALSVLLIVVSITAAVLLYVHTNTKDLIYNYKNIDSVPERDVAIVFGASVNAKTQLPSDILADRIKTGIDLYKAGKVKKLLMSGDNSVTHYNEPIVMQKYAEFFGVPTDDIVLDYAGRRTYDTCYRAKDIFQLEEAILITQQYHLHRALYTCNALGVNSIGIDSSLHRYREQFYYNLREIPATLLAVWQVNVSRPKPILGSVEEVFDEGSSRLSD